MRAQLDVLPQPNEMSSLVVCLRLASRWRSVAEVKLDGIMKIVDVFDCRTVYHGSKGVSCHAVVTPGVS